MVAACQKGLMTPPGLAFTFHGPKAEAARVACASPYWDWGPRTGARGLLPALLRHRADAPPLRAALRPRHDPGRGGARGGLDPARRLRPGGLGGGRGLGRRRRARAQHRRARDPQPRGDDDPHHARRRRAAAALVRRRRRADARHRARACPASIPTACSASATWGTSTRRCCSARSATIEAGLRALGIAHGAGAVEAAAAVIAAAGSVEPAGVSAMEIAAGIDCSRQRGAPR